MGEWKSTLYFLELQDRQIYAKQIIGSDFAIVFYKFDNIFSNNRIIAKQH